MSHKKLLVKSFVITLGVVLALALSTVTAFAVWSYFWSAPANIEVIPRAQNYDSSSLPIKVYHDQACTQEITSFNYPQIQQGSGASFGFYAKNLSQNTLQVGIKVTSDISAWASTSLAPVPQSSQPSGTITHGDYLTLLPNQVGFFGGTINVLLNAPIGMKTFYVGLYDSTLATQ